MLEEDYDELNISEELNSELGINLDAQRVSGSNSIWAKEVELRRVLYWSMYCDDKLAAAYTGRVCTLLVSILDAVPVQLPLTSCIGCSRTGCMAIRPGPGRHLTRHISPVAKSTGVDVAYACSHPAFSHIGGYHGVFVSKHRRVQLA